MKDSPNNIIVLSDTEEPLTEPVPDGLPIDVSDSHQEEYILPV